MTDLHNDKRVRAALRWRAAEVVREHLFDHFLRWSLNDLDTVTRLIAHFRGLGPFAETPWPPGESAPRLVLRSDRGGWELWPMPRPDPIWFAASADDVSDMALPYIDSYIPGLAAFTDQSQALDAARHILAATLEEM